RKFEVAREDADDGEWLTVQIEWLSDRVRVPREMSFPERVTDDYDVCGVRLLFFDLKIATEHGVELESRKEVRGDAHSLHALGLVLLEECEAVHFVSGNRLEAAALRAQILDVDVRDGVFLRLIFLRAPDRDDAVGFDEVGGVEDQRVDHAEDGGIGSDTECKSDHCNHCEPGLLPHPTQRKPQVLPKVTHDSVASLTSDSALLYELGRHAWARAKSG